MAHQLPPFPVEKEINLEKFDTEKPVWMPYSEHGMNATFKGLFSDVVVEDIDLAKMLNPRPSSTFIVRVGGNSMKDERITSGDKIIIDKSLPYVDGKKIAYWLNDFQGWTVKTLSIRNDGYWLIPANAEDTSLFEYKIQEYDIPWGMVTWILHNEYHRK
ncbi:MAG: S24 family peptidase [Chitinophagales bacterium]